MPTKQLTIISWNISSLRPTTLQTVKQYHPHIICLQETRQNIQSSPKFIFYNQLRKQHSQGGGICIGVHKSLVSRDISRCINLIDVEFIMLQCISVEVELIILNIYSPVSTNIQKNKSIIQNWYIQLKLRKPKVLFVLTGDINKKSLKIKGLKDIIPSDQFTYSRYKLSELIRTKTDVFLIENKQEVRNTCFIESLLSDHLMIIGTLSLKISSKSEKLFRIVMNKQEVLKLNIRFTNSENFNEFYDLVMANYHQHQIYKRKRIGLEQFNLNYQKQLNIDQFIAKIENKLRTEESKLSHFLIRQLIITNPNKRDGNIMNCYIDESDNLISDYQLILKNVLEVLGNIQGLQEFHPSTLPTLPLVNFNKFKHMQQRIGRNKALTDILISDTWISQHGTFLILNDLWNDNTRLKVPNFGQFLIIPLNKCSPKIPNKDEFHPITILSSLYKWLELRLEFPLRQYCISKLIHQQGGFVEGLNTHVQIINLMQNINRIKSIQKNVCYLQISNQHTTQQIQTNYMLICNNKKYYLIMNLNFQKLQFQINSQ